jgi:AAA domain
MTSPPRTHLRLVSGDTPGGHAAPAVGPASPETGQPAPLRTAWTADELMAMRFPEPRWAVPGILAEGVSLFAGPPKVGKSWLSLGVALAVASGGKALEAIPTQPGPVLYLALEDTPRRLQSRIRKILAGQHAPSGLTLVTSCPTLPDGGEQAIARWLERNPDARMVVIDVFAKMRGAPPAGLSAYDADYHAMSRAKRLADTYGVAVLLVHHVRKMGSDDFLNEVSGTNGLAGAADATLVLKRARGQADGVLHVTGRDVDEAEYALSFQSAAGVWHLLDGPPEDHTLSDTRAAILRHVRAHPDSPPKQIAEAIGISHDNTRKTCQRMASDGQLQADAAGRYRLPPVPTPDTVPAVTAVPTPGPTSENTDTDEGQAPVPAVPHSRPTTAEEDPQS